jgi:hypothetical protein
MDRIFTANKWFVAFCAALIIVWVALQFVINLRLTAIAKMDSERILDWSWPSKNLRSKAEVVSAEVLKRSETDAVVKVKAKQQLLQQNQPGEPFVDTGGINDCQAILTYYKANHRWFLGKVEVQ